MAADNLGTLYVTLPSEQLSSGLTVKEKIDINKQHSGDDKSLKQRIQESYEDNKPLSIVAYWYSLNGCFSRAYASYEVFKQRRNALNIRAATAYNITFTPPREYLVTHCNELELDNKNY